MTFCMQVLGHRKWASTHRTVICEMSGDLEAGQLCRVVLMLSAACTCLSVCVWPISQG